MNSGVGMSAMSFSLHKGLLIQQLHSIVSPALDMTFLKCVKRWRFGIWNRVYPVVFTSTRYNLQPWLVFVHPLTRSSSSTEEMGRDQCRSCWSLLLLFVRVLSQHITLISHIHSLNSEHRYVECKRKILKHQDVSDWLCPPGCRKQILLQWDFRRWYHSTHSTLLWWWCCWKATEMGSSLGDKIGFCSVDFVYITPTH